VFPLVSMANRENENDESQVSSPVSKEIVELAVELLLKVINSKPKDQKPQRVDRKEFICLVVQLKMRVDSTNTIPESIPVPHPLFRFDGSQAICLIIGDEIEGLNAEVAENKIKDEGLPISRSSNVKSSRLTVRHSNSRTGTSCVSLSICSWPINL